MYAKEKKWRTLREWENFVEQRQQLIVGVNSERSNNNFL